VSRFRYPCTRHADTTGFGDFLHAGLGPSRGHLRAFARELGETLKADRVTLVNSGSSANLAAALALAEECGPSPHAITAGFTFPTTLSALLQAGFAVTVVDTAPGTFTIDPAAIRRALRPDTRLVCVTHFLGFPADLRGVREVVGPDVLVLQDACETMSLPLPDRGTLTTYSFYHPHHLSAYGGGAVVSIDEARHRRLESVVHWGRACTCHVDGLPCAAPEGAGHQFHYVRRGLNLEMSELNAAFGRYQLRTWEVQEAARQRRYAILQEALAGHTGAITYAAPTGGSPFVFPLTLRSGDATAVTDRLRADGIEARTLMGGPITDQPAYRDVRDDGLAACRDLSRRSFFVGVHQTLPEEDVRAVAAALGRALG